MKKKIAFGQCMGCQCLLLCHSALWPCGFAYHHEPCGFAFFLLPEWHGTIPDKDFLFFDGIFQNFTNSFLKKCLLLLKKDWFQNQKK